jgi:hypothetical protein
VRWFFVLGTSEKWQASVAGNHDDEASVAGNHDDEASVAGNHDDDIGYQCAGWIIAY